MTSMWPNMSRLRAGLIALALGGVVLAVGWVIDPRPQPTIPSTTTGPVVRGRCDPGLYPRLAIWPVTDWRTIRDGTPNDLSRWERFPTTPS